MKRIWKAVGAILTALACPAVTLASVSVSLSPTTVHVLPGGQMQFTAVVNGTTNNVVVWSLAGTNCSGISCGQITNEGLYLAPATAPNPNVVTVTATSLQDLSVSASAAVIVGTSSDITVTVSPSSATVLTGQQQQFVAFVSGTTITGVSWRLSGTSCSSSACGTITAGGVYTAPAKQPSPSQVTVQAVSVADPSRSGSATVTVALPVAVAVAPTAATVTAGKQQQFTATVSNTTNTAVTWTIAGSGCSGASCGSITAGGLYTAPSSVPNPAQVSVTATSVADTSKSATATVTIVPPVAISIAPKTAQLLTGAHQQFTATVTNTTNTAVTWTVSGSGCSGSACGTITASGLYTAPASAPRPSVVTITATSAADSTKSASASVTIVPPLAIAITPTSADVVTGAHQQFTATVTNSTNTAVTWTVSGSGCTGSACGTITTGGVYTAPSSVPSPAQVSVTATSVADTSKSATATVTIVPPVAVTITPTAVQLLPGAHQQFTATVTHTTNTAVSWSVAGSGCSGTACGTVTSAGLYTAPSVVPSPDQVFVTVTSAADASKSATASVSLIPPVAVTLSPPSVQLLTGAHQQFTATVLNTTNTAVTWSIAGTGCTGATCGTISTSGLYTAPAAAPSPNLVTVKATSVADTSKFATASVTIAGPILVSISPTSATITLGLTQQFTATVTGSSNKAVSWTVAGSGCTGAACGTVTSAGLYTAPFVLPTPAQVFVTATAGADASKSATAVVNLVPLVGVTISPITATLTTGGHQQFTASVSGTSNNSVTWSVSGNGCTGSACGTISSSGLYTAPSAVPSPAQVTVKVASGANPARYATATVTIIPPVGITVSPTTANVVAGNHQQFTATVTGNSNTAVTWSVSGAGCTGAACGVISSTGLYNAPGAVPSPAQVTVRATSEANTSKSATATVTILPPVAVKVSPAAIEVVAGEHQQFTAAVTGTQNSSVLWTLSGSGCSGSTCGTITSAGLYTAPATIPSPPQVTVTAISTADTTKSASATVTVIPPVHVIISPVGALLATDGQLQFRATVSGSTNTAVDWSVSGSGCSGSACGTITTAGLYTAPAALPSPATVIVKASAQIDVTQSASSAVTLVATENSRLQGQYAFQFTGFDSSGIYQSAGSFTADGNGNINAGLEDINSTAGPMTDSAFTGTYQLGGDNRGVLTFSGATGAQTFRFALNVTATSARFIEFDSTGIRGSGVIEKQDPSAFSLSALSGAYVLSLAGRDSAGSRIGALGIVDLNGAGSIPGGSMDVNDGGVITPTFSSFAGIYRVDANGRGILNLSIPGFDGGEFRFAFYIVTAEKLFLLSVDPLSSNNPIFSGPVELQTGAPYLSASFSGPVTFSLSGEQSNTPEVAVGRIVFDGISQPLVQFDENAGGTISTNNILTGAYSVGVNGPGTLNLDDSNGHARTWDMYAIAPNHAFLLDTSAAAGMGELNAQTITSISNVDILGTYLLGTGDPLVSSATLSSGITNFDGRSAMKGTEDVSESSSSLSAQSLAGTYSLSTSLNDGRGTLLLTSPSGKTVALWVTGASKVLALDLDSSNTQPVVWYFEQ